MYIYKTFLKVFLFSTSEYRSNLLQQSELQGKKQMQYKILL